MVTNENQQDGCPDPKGHSDYISSLEARLRAVADIVKDRDDDLAKSIQDALHCDDIPRSQCQSHEEFAADVLARLLAHPAFPFIAKRLVKHEMSLLLSV